MIKTFNFFKYFGLSLKKKTLFLVTENGILKFKDLIGEDFC